MNDKKKNLLGGDSEFDEFWGNFQLLPWKWADELASRSRYVVGALIIVYILAFIMTYFPDNSWLAPKEIPSRILWINDQPVNVIELLGGDKFLFLIHYKSMNFIFIGVVLAMMLMIRWRYLIPHFFEWLWNSQRLGGQADEPKKEFEHYLQSYQTDLNKKSVPIVLSLSLISMFWVLVSDAGVLGFFENFFIPTTMYAIYFGVFVAFLILFMMGQFSWALFITGRYIGKLPKVFSIEIEPDHPDHCGGLKPIGDFCVDGVLSLLVMGILFAGMSIFQLDIDEVSSFMATVFLFVLVAPLTILAIFAPLWTIHEEMMRQKHIYEDKYVSQYNELKLTIHANTALNGNLDKAKIAKEKLDIYQLMHPEKIPYPVWPIRLKDTVLVAFSPQILAAALETGKKIYDLIFPML